MSVSEPARVVPPPLARDSLNAARYHLGGRRGLLLLGGAVVVAGLAFNWGWLVAVGAAPLLLSLLPCLAMCALDLCMNRVTSGSCSAEKGAVPGGALTTPAVARDPDQLTLDLETPVPMVGPGYLGSPATAGERSSTMEKNACCATR